MGVQTEGKLGGRGLVRGIEMLAFSFFRFTMSSYFASIA